MERTNISETATLINAEVDSTSRIFDAFVKNTKVAEHCIVRDGCRIEETVLHAHVDIQRNAMMYHAEIDEYTYTGRNFVAWHTKIGKYCSISWNVSIGGANHDYHRISQHAFLYAPQFGFLEQDDTPKYNRFTDECEIGNDVWIACNAVVCRGVHIGNGAVVAAGAVVTKDVEPYTVVAGVPAKPIKRRCPIALASRLNKASWWNLNPGIIKENLDLFSAEICEDSVRRIEELVSEHSILAK